MAAVAIGALISGAAYAIVANENGMPITLKGMLGQMLIGAATAAVCFGVGQAASSMFSQSAMGFWQGAYQGAVIGGCTGVAGVLSNALFTGNNLTLNAVMGGAAVGALTGAIMGGIKAEKVKANFKKGTEALGVADSENAKIPVNDSTLSNAQKAWYPDAPMDKVKSFTVQKVPSEWKPGLISNGGSNAAITVPEVANNLTTGNSSVFFDKTAFSSLKNLYYTMGHELVHVSQNALLSGLTIAQYNAASNNIYKEYFGYKYEYDLGNTNPKNNYGEYIHNYSGNSPNLKTGIDYFNDNQTLYNKFNYTNFSWTKNAHFIKKF